ncbi:MAG TPA: hypothetical protein VGN95_11915 [Pyrinomonadaceae bacterium]|jgi:hypothetical protein|nr:hypothetical protein [Pyrinomonadaceae bacterium]
MSKLQTILRLFLLLTFTLAITSPAQAQSTSTFVRSDDPIATMTLAPTTVMWSPHVEYASLVLTVSLPGGEVFRQEFERGANPSFSLETQNGLKRPDGHYIYELRLIPVVSQQSRATLAASREIGNSKAVTRELQQTGQLATREVVQTGTFLVSQGAILSNASSEGASLKNSSSQISSQQTNITAPPPVLEDQVIPDDLIVQGSGCFGFDCVNNESFGFDTLRLKENNLRIHFDDTSSSAGFANNDWTLVANDSASGGMNKFSIEDTTAARTPFTILAGAPSDSFFLDSTGRLGLRTATPALDIHVNTGNTPAVRLEQNAGGGFTAQTWDIGANEANFFVRDLTGGSRLPFRIRPGAPTSSVDISATGNVGIGKANAGYKLDTAGTINATAFYLNGVPFSSSATVSSGTNTTNKIVKWSDGPNHTLGDSVITESSGNVGIGTTAFDLWDTTTFKVLGINTNSGFTIAAGSTSGNALHITDRAYYNGTNWIYSASSTPVSNYNQGSGVHAFRVAPGGATGSTITWTNALSINNSGSVGIGTTTPQSALQVSGYVQLDLTSGAPPAVDCDAVAEYGRMKVDATGNKLYVCTSTGWKSTILTP